MKLILTGTAMHQYDTKQIEINGTSMIRTMGQIHTDAGEIFPILVWGETKTNYWKNFADSMDHLSIVVELQAKPQTYTNHEGQTVTVPNIQLKLYSYLNMPSNHKQTAPQTPKQNFWEKPAADPTGSFVSSTPEQKAEYLKPFDVNGTPGLETIL